MVTSSVEYKCVFAIQCLLHQFDASMLHLSPMIEEVGANDRFNYSDFFGSDTCIDELSHPRLFDKHVLTHNVFHLHFKSVGRRADERRKVSQLVLLRSDVQADFLVLELNRSFCTVPGITCYLLLVLRLDRDYTTIKLTIVRFPS